MTEHHSTPPPDQSKSPPAKPEKPYPDFPLYARAAGCWAKTIRGQKHYFGQWNDPEGALAKYNDRKAGLTAGRRPKDAASAADVAVRGHWGIENSVHWVLDVSFREDESRVRKDHAPENLALVRRLAAALLKQDQTPKGGIACKRKQAGWDNAYLEQVLGAKLG